MRRLSWLLFLFPALLSADVRLPALIGDHMLIQQRKPVHLWGWAEAGEAVSATIAGKSGSTTTGADGRWSLYLEPLEAGGPHKLEIRGANRSTIDDVLVGEVWVGSGQSNMVMSVERSNNPEKEIAAATDGQIRLFKVALETADEPEDDVDGEWMVCSPKTVGPFSGPGYFFARHLRSKLNVPIGVIQSAWGGTPAQSWTQIESLDADPALHVFVDDWRQVIEAHPRAQARFEADLKAWEKKGDSKAPKPREPMGPGHHHQPASLYNAMIAPLIPYPIAGVIWYQGENNASRNQGYEYRRLFRTMIEDWRTKWGVGAFPFLFVQLANYARAAEESEWPELREAQTMALGLIHTGMAVTIDIGESQDIHPKNKQDVGTRLALAARAVAYGDDDVVYSGPIFRQVTSEDGKLRLWFDHVGGGLVGKGGLDGFQIAGPDGRFHAAQAKIDGSTLVVSSPHVKQPIAARYAWHRDPPATLFNREGLPASPFRTDDWRE